MSLLLSRRGTVHRPAAGGGGGGFDRLGVTGLREWWEASDLALNNNDPVSSWDGAKNSLTLTSAGPPAFKSSAVNGLPAVEFTGQRMQYNNDPGWAQPNTYFLVGQQTGNGVFFDGTGASLRNLFYRASSIWRMFAGSEITHSTVDSNWHLFTCVFDGASSVLRIDGTQVASGNVGSQTHQFIRIGQSRLGGDALVGNIAVFAGVSGVLSSGERDDVEDYLMTRYGL